MMVAACCSYSSFHLSLGPAKVGSKTSRCPSAKLRHWNAIGCTAIMMKNASNYIYDTATNVCWQLFDSKMGHLHYQASWGLPKAKMEITISTILSLIRVEASRWMRLSAAQEKDVRENSFVIPEADSRISRSPGPQILTPVSLVMAGKTW